MQLIKKVFLFFWARVYSLAAAFVIAGGWMWYHGNKHHLVRLVITTFCLAVGTFVAYQIGEWFYGFLVRHFRRHPFWQKDFRGFLDRIFFIFSLLFVVFLSRNELVSIIYVSLVLFVLFWRLQTYIARHPAPDLWLVVNKQIFALAYFVFIVQAALQYAAYHYYILDSNIKFFNIVLFRSAAMTGFWLLGFAVASTLYWRLQGFFRYVAVTLWGLFFSLTMALWAVNIGILYYSGLYFSPVVIDHATGAGSVAGNRIAYVLAIIFLAVLTAFIWLLRSVFKAHGRTQGRYWHYYNAVIALMAFGAIFGLSSFKNTPEHQVVRSFYNHYFGTETKVELPLALQEKLERFGLVYDLGAFKVSHHPTVFSTSTPVQKLLPEKFLAKKPNIVIFYLESYSARLTEVYNPGRFPGLTPGLVAFAADPGTTVFRNFYNASTPTITGTLSQMCSFLPPTGHNEIQNDRKLQNHHLLCFPEILKKNAGYKHTAYVTAVDKEYANKEGIFTSAGVDKVYGTDELKKYIAGEPLSWGYSDHQLFPATWNFIEAAPQPFLMMLATVDTHPPFNLAQDVVPYGDGKQDVLNSFHTTDNAFRKFWEQFKESPLYENTIVVAVADHAIFPAALTKDLFPAEAKTLSYYDENAFLMYVPDSVLPKEVTTYSSGIDVTPTLLHMLDINVPNSFEGHSIFDDRTLYPNLLGMHELGLYINQSVVGKRKIDYDIPDELDCPEQLSVSSTAPLTLCEFAQFYKWKRQMFEEGRLWEK